MQPLSLEYVLMQLPHLRQLGLDCTKMPLDLQYVSQSIQYVVVASLSPGVVESLARAKLPALKSVLVEGMDLSSLWEMTDDEKLEQAGRFADKAATLPLEVWLAEDEAFSVFGWLSDEEEPERWSRELCAHMSVELAPLSEILSSVQKLSLSSWDVTSHHSVAVLSNLMGNVRDLEMRLCFEEDITPIVFSFKACLF